MEDEFNNVKEFSIKIWSFLVAVVLKDVMEKLIMKVSIGFVY